MPQDAQSVVVKQKNYARTRTCISVQEGRDFSFFISYYLQSIVVKTIEMVAVTTRVVLQIGLVLGLGLKESRGWSKSSQNLLISVTNPLALQHRLKLSNYLLRHITLLFIVVVYDGRIL